MLGRRHLDLYVAPSALRDQAVGSGRAFRVGHGEEDAILESCAHPGVKVTAVSTGG